MFETPAFDMNIVSSGIRERTLPLLHGWAEARARVAQLLGNDVNFNCAESNRFERNLPT